MWRVCVLHTRKERLMTFAKKSIRVLIVPYLFTFIIFFLLSVLQEISIAQRLNWPTIFIDFGMDMASITVAFGIFYYLLNKLYSSESKLLSSNNTLSETNYELESFIYRASHDFRTPLTNIKGILIAFDLEKDAKVSKHYLEMLKECADMMDSRLLELMEIATSKHKAITTEKINIATLIKELIQEISFTASLDRINIVVEQAEDVVFFSDTARLKILLRNILMNAVKYKDPRKKTGTIKISVVKDAQYVTIRFWDNGIGINEGVLPKVFEMFYRGTQLSNGSGLGLYIAKTIAITLNYNIQIDSKENEWTAVNLIIPQVARR